MKIGAKRSPVRTPAAARDLAARSWRGPASSWPGSWATRPTSPAWATGRWGALAGARDPLDQAAVGGGDRASGAPPWWPPCARWRRVEIVNGGGTGSLHTTAREPAVTEVTAGSGLYAPTLFDRYADFTPIPAAMFALPVVRRPSGGVATLLGGGYHASGPGGPRPAARALPAAAGCASTPARAPARCRRR